MIISSGTCFAVVSKVEQNVIGRFKQAFSFYNFLFMANTRALIFKWFQLVLTYKIQNIETIINIYWFLDLFGEFRITSNLSVVEIYVQERSSTNYQI